MSERLSDEALDVLFRKARTHNVWLDKPVGDDILRALYDLMKWGPTSANTCPARIIFLRTQPAKQRLQAALSATNVDKTMAAPVTAILAYDLDFFNKVPRLFPDKPEMRDVFAKSPQIAEITAFRNGTLQGGYFILAARSLGLDCGPMSGFDNAKVDKEFFSTPAGEAGSTTDFIATDRLKSNFLCNLGYGDSSRLFPRNPRLDFDEACKLL